MKRGPYRAAFAAMTISLAVACSPNTKVKVVVGDEAAADNTLKSAMAADTAFSGDAQTLGMGEAFARYMDAIDGTAIGPGSVTRGEAAIRASFKDWPADLKMTWSPDLGYGSKAGDLAVTSGRWKQTRAGAALAEGRYVTVWRRNEKGEWKGVIDIGADDPKPLTLPNPVQLRPAQQVAPAPGTTPH
jgi:ketosteroid isomerase-like protein